MIIANIFGSIPSELYRFIVLVLIGGIIGYLTNKVAIKMLFRPVNPVRFLGITIQGVFPKRKDQMAISLADTIQNELLTKEVLVEKLLNPESVDKLKARIKETLVEELSDSIPPMAKMFLGDNPKEKIARLLDKKGDEVIDNLINDLKENGLDNINIRDIVKERIDQLDFIEFERIIFGLMSRELKFVEVVGLFLGGVIGMLQFVVTLFI
jgi:uncharacterized membrane protein YheB (UPF0754 family)